MFKHRFTRRDFLKTAGTLAAATACGSNSQISSAEKGSDGDPRLIFSLRDTLSVSVGGSTGFIYTPNIYLTGQEVPWVRLAQMYLEFQGQFKLGCLMAFVMPDLPLSGLM